MSLNTSQIGINKILENSKILIKMNEMKEIYNLLIENFKLLQDKVTDELENRSNKIQDKTTYNLKIEEMG